MKDDGPGDRERAEQEPWKEKVHAMERGCVEDQPQHSPTANALRLVEDDTAALRAWMLELFFMCLHWSGKLLRAAVNSFASLIAAFQKIKQREFHWLIGDDTVKRKT